MRGPQGFFAALALGDVTEHVRKATQMLTAVSQRHDDHLGVERLTALAREPAFDLQPSERQRLSQTDAWATGLWRRRLVESREMSANDFIGGITQDALRGAIP